MVANQLDGLLNPRVQFKLTSTPEDRSRLAPHAIVLGDKSVPLAFVHHRRARRYVLRVRADGTARVTIPRGGSESAARRFAERNTEWLRRQMERLAARPVATTAWPVGTEILFRGVAAKIDAGLNAFRFADQTVRVIRLAEDCRPAIEHHLRRLAAVELPPRVLHFARQHGLTVQRVTVRNQKSRWGSCSRRGAISLNWRLVQAPAYVADYIILHELMHLRQMNHSPKFWHEVEQVCPGFRDAERWLKAHGRLLR